jgi:hypothetical protein
MIGLGAIVGTIAGGHTNAARLAAPVEVAGTVEVVADTADMPAPAPVAQPREPSPASIVAMRFPARSQYMQIVETRAPAPVTTPVLAFAAEPQRKAAAPAPAPANSFHLASVDSAPPMPKRVARPAPPKNPVLFNDAQLASIKARLRLTPDQERYWPQVEQALRAISWRIATQQNAKRPVRGNQASMIDPGSPEVQRLKSAAFPLIMSMREDQKREVRQLAHTMGLAQVAAQF